MPDYTGQLNRQMPGAADLTADLDIALPPRRTDANPEALKDAIVKTDMGDYRFRGYRLTATGIVEDNAASEDDWAELGLRLLSMAGRMQWWIGDWAISRRGEWGARYAHIVEMTGNALSTIDDYAYVCRAVKFSVRTEKLEFGYHKLLAACDEDTQDLWLVWAARQSDISISQLRQYMDVLAPYDVDGQRDWLLWASGQEEMTPDILREAVRKANGWDNPSLSQKPPALFAPEQIALLRDVRNVLKNEQKLAKTSAAALRASAQELAQIVQKMHDLADAKEGTR